MTKVGAEDDDIIYQGDYLTIRAVRRRNGALPAKEWFDNLDPKVRARVMATARVLETSWRSGRPDPEKWSKLKSHDLWAFRATSKKAQPSLRIYGERDGGTLWAALGVTKKRQKANRRDINRAITILKERETP